MAATTLQLSTTRDREFLDEIENTRYDRQITKGLKKFVELDAPDEMQNFYTVEELEELSSLRGTARDVEARMPVKITKHYFDLAKNSPALQRLVKANPAETLDLDGAPDPGKQMNFSPVEGIIHKYELGLLYVTNTCSAHCRFCYREELIARKEVERPDGTVAPKGLAKPEVIAAYIERHNDLVESNGGVHPETGRPRLREVLMSGGDPMVLSNRKIAEWLSALATAGIENIRIGTKEMAFFPDRFDASWFDMLDRFHTFYPGVSLRMMLHFNHPDEILQKDGDGNFVADPAGGLMWHESTARAARGFASRPFASMDNQAPIIKGINDDPDKLRILQRELRRHKVENAYFFCGRDIVGHKAFNVPIETAWQILNESQKGLSGVETHARLSITHYKGKTEVSAVTSQPLAGVPGTEKGFVVLKLLRSIAEAPDRGKVTIVGRNPEAIWFSGYNDRVIFDEAGLFSGV